MSLGWITIGIAVVGSICSGLYAWKAFDIFDAEKPEGARLCHQYWLNFAGSAVGWIALGLLTYKMVRCIETSCPAEVSMTDLVLGGVAFVGVTGHLPYVTVNAMAAAVKAVEKWIERQDKAKGSDKST